MLILWLLHKEERMIKLAESAQRQMEEKSANAQRKYFLNEQMKSLKKALGLDRDGKESLLSKFEDRLKLLKVNGSSLYSFKRRFALIYIYRYLQK